MAKTRNKTMVFKKVPEGYPKPDEDIVIEDRPIDLETPPPENGVLAQVLVVSFDPYQRGRLRPAHVKSYFPPYPLDGAMTNSAVVRVVASANARFAKGDVVRVPFCDIAEYAVIPGGVFEQLDVFKVETPGEQGVGIEPAHFLGVLGMPGLTAFSALYEIGKPKKGETIFVSSAAGAVGSLVGQLAKREGLRVIGSVGSDEKAEWITRELGYDAAFNYKKESPSDALARLAPDGIDICFENVGGDHLNAAIDHMNKYGRIPFCGAIATYNTSDPLAGAIARPMQMIGKEITLRGFLVASFRKQYFQQHRDVIIKGLADGSIKTALAVTEGIDNGPKGFVGMLRGENFGKSVLKIAD